MVFEAMIPLKFKDYRLNGCDNSIPGGYSSAGLRFPGVFVACFDTSTKSINKYSPRKLILILKISQNDGLEKVVCFLLNVSILGIYVRFLGCIMNQPGWFCTAIPVAFRLGVEPHCFIATNSDLLSPQLDIKWLKITYTMIVGAYHPKGSTKIWKMVTEPGDQPNFRCTFAAD